MPENKRTTLSAQILVESSSESEERTVGYVVSALKNSFRNIRDGTVVITIYDENEHLIGADMSGSPSAEIEDVFDDLVDKLGEVEVKVQVPTPKPPPRSQ